MSEREVPPLAFGEVPPLAFGSWPSPITTDLLVAGATGLTDVWVEADGDTVWWSETRPSEGGRTAVCRRGADGELTEVTGPADDARSRVHEYGGGAWWVHGGELFWVHGADQRIRRRRPGAPAVELTPEPPRERSLRYADGRVSPDGRWVVCVRETHAEGVDGGHGRVDNEIVAVDASGTQEVRALVSGPDFVSNPRISPDGTTLAWLQWNHPDMPWDATELWVGSWRDGTLTDARRLAGAGGAEWLFQPEWSPDGSLWWVSDANGWSQVMRSSPPHDAGGVEVRADLHGAEVATPPWVFGVSRLVVNDEGAAYALTRPGGDVVVLPGGHEVDLGSTVVTLAASRDGVVAIVGSHQHERALVRHRRSGDTEVVVAGRDLPSLGVTADLLPEPEPIAFPTTGGETAHALFYAPANPEARPPEGELAPLLVLAHGGPTGSARNELALNLRFWTSRGFAVVDVDYRGSTGYGRAYRRALDGRWGVADVDDCVAAVRHLTGTGRVDPQRVAIRGGSAGGFTVLCALTFHEVFTAGISRYGIGDLETLAADTHKFEARYLDRLVGPYPDRRDVYVERSPIHHVERLSCPMLLLQGLDDAVVPPQQAEAMAAALATNGVAHTLVTFEGEGHGFRRAETIVAAQQAELDFLAEQFGFTPAG